MITCIIREIFNFPCPTCGVPRAMFSLLKLDIKSYFYYNAFALPLCIATLLIFVNQFKKKKIFLQIGISILILNLPYYFFRLVNDFIP